MIVGLCTNSATSLLRFRITMNRWYLDFLVTHLNWPVFLQNVLASSSSQQFQVKSNVDFRELKWLSLWRPPPNTLNTKTSCFNLRWKKNWKKNLTVNLSLWSDDMDIEPMHKYIKIYKYTILYILYMLYVLYIYMYYIYIYMYYIYIYVLYIYMYYIYICTIYIYIYTIHIYWYMIWIMPKKPIRTQFETNKMTK